MESTQPQQTEKEAFDNSSLNYINSAASWAIVVAILLAVRICFTIYYLISYFRSTVLSDQGWDSSAVSYFGSSLFGALLSFITIIFLLQFSQYARRVYRDSNVRDWEGVFANFRNYLLFALILSLNWLIFYVSSIVFNGLF